MTSGLSFTVTVALIGVLFALTLANLDRLEGVWRQHQRDVRTIRDFNQAQRAARKAARRAGSGAR